MKWWQPIYPEGGVSSGTYALNFRKTKDGCMELVNKNKDVVKRLRAERKDRLTHSHNLSFPC